MLLRVKEIWYNVTKTPLYTSKWHGWLLSFLSRKCLYNYNFRGTNGNPFSSKYVTSVPKLIEKLNMAESFSIKDHVYSFYNDVPGVLCVSLIDLLSNESLVQNHHECIVVSNQELDDDEMSIDEFYDFGNNSFELQFMSISTHLNGNNSKWDGKMAFRHGGPNQPS